MTKIAILGFGVVGSGVLEILTKNQNSINKKTNCDVEVKKILDIRDFSDHEYAHLFTDNYDEILNDDEIKVIAEVIGGVEPSYTFTKKALEKGKSVVSSNKELVALHGAELMDIAEKNGAHYMFEASVGGGIPVLRPLGLCLAANDVYEICGILNGTTNYILNKMFVENVAFDEALKSAQKKGYAERNPSADVDGIDACRKISILMSIAYGKQLDCSKIFTEGIRNITIDDVSVIEEMNCVVKLLGYGKICDDKVFARVSPVIIPKDHVLANVRGVYNGVMVTGSETEEVTFIGRGAGKLPTASAVVADILDIVKNDKHNYTWTHSDNTDFMIDINDTDSKFFVRVNNISDDIINDIIGDVSFCKCNDSDYKAFVTKEINEAVFSEMKSSLIKAGAEILSVIRVIY
ncbi:MAG: homoserine dehydrogenase [Clostridia bacterium]|nr:homoserine dehydrogenase [Clostridia bacterium]